MSRSPQNPLTIARNNIIGRTIGLAGSAVLGGIPFVDLYNQRDTFVNQNQNFVFPTDLKTAYIHMQFTKYTRRSINEQPFFSPVNSIRLPIPKELVDTVSVQYSTDNLGPLVGSVVEGISGVSSFSGAVESLIGGIQQGSAGAGAGAALLQQTVSQQLLAGASALTGITINPYQSVLFKTPNFKRHKFSWKLVPKNEPESDLIENILKIFKYHMLPGISQSTSVFFSYPEILRIKLFPKEEYLYKFKPCVVESVSVNYAPNGPSFYRASNAPTAVEFSINLQEIEIWTKADYLRNNQGIYNEPRRTQEQNVRLAQQARPFTGE